MIQIRNVPGSLHRKLKARAAMAGMSLSDYLLAEIRRFGEQPTIEDMIKRLESLPSLPADPPPEDVIREERDRR